MTVGTEHSEATFGFFVEKVTKEESRGFFNLEGVRIDSLEVKELQSFYHSHWNGRMKVNLIVEGERVSVETNFVKIMN